MQYVATESSSPKEAQDSVFNLLHDGKNGDIPERGMASWVDVHGGTFAKLVAIAVFCALQD
jgi:hypothetical protein